MLREGRGREGVEEAGGQRRPAEAAARPRQEKSQPHLVRGPGSRAGARRIRSAPAAGPNPRPRPEGESEPGSERAEPRSELEASGVRPRLFGAAFSNSARWALRRQRGRGAFCLTLGGPGRRRRSGCRVGCAPSAPDLTPRDPIHFRIFPIKPLRVRECLVEHIFRAWPFHLDNVIGLSWYEMVPLPFLIGGN